MEMIAKTLLTDRIHLTKMLGVTVTALNRCLVRQTTVIAKNWMSSDVVNVGCVNVGCVNIRRVDDVNDRSRHSLRLDRDRKGPTRDKARFC